MRDAIKLILALPVGVVGGATCMWWGINSGLLSILGLGLAVFGMSVLVIPHAIPILRWLLRRAKR
ncbi:hypothetical protein BST20_04150 [Mycobacterium branderi]|uniref:Uncharacterized protein n=2 Tax=Mycobacterium branderi TaxID=43348 RepID=A0A7I7W093_9MYCO|nr:hypothetical protein BST20_04150 [Mycobacterium branderi]BBZ10352.1 hypothetical protein MBRA_05470 [Mycobacterium branderi]